MGWPVIPSKWMEWQAKINPTQYVSLERCKGKGAACLKERRWDAHLVLGRWARRGINHCLWRMASATPDCYLPSISQYQFILLGSRGTHMWTTCPKLYLKAWRLGVEPMTWWSQVPHANHYTNDNTQHIERIRCVSLAMMRYIKRHWHWNCLFNGTFSINRLYCTIKVGNIISCRGRRQHKYIIKWKKRSERCKQCEASCSKVQTVPTRPLQIRKHTDRTDYNTLCRS